MTWVLEQQGSGGSLPSGPLPGYGGRVWACVDCELQGQRVRVVDPDNGM
jgi:hypothetical protein